MSERLVKALEEIHAIEAPYPDCGHLDIARARGIAAAALADHRAQAGEVPNALTHDQLTPMSRFLADRGIYLTNETLRSLAALAPRTAAPTRPPAVPELPEPDAWGGQFYSDRSIRTYGQQCYEAGRQQGVEQARAYGPIDISAFAGWTAEQKLSHVQSALRWAACGYVNSPERMQSLRVAWKLVSELVSELAFNRPTSPADSAVASGAWRLAPLEPTREMDEAGYATLKPKYHWLGYDLFRAYYRAMIVAAPQPGQEGS